MHTDTQVPGSPKAAKDEKRMLPLERKHREWHFYGARLRGFQLRHVSHYLQRGLHFVRIGFVVWCLNCKTIHLPGLRYPWEIKSTMPRWSITENKTTLLPILKKQALHHDLVRTHLSQEAQGNPTSPKDLGVCTKLPGTCLMQTFL